MSRLPDECVHGAGEPQWCVLCLASVRRAEAAAKKAAGSKILGQTPLRSVFGADAGSMRGALSTTKLAAFTTVCPNCDGPIEPGDPIATDPDTGWVHAECLPERNHP